MKKILLAALTLSLFACSKDDKKVDNYYETAILGKWAPTTTTANGITEPYDDHEDCGKDYIAFQAGGVLSTTDVFNCEEETNFGTYAISQNFIVANLYGASQALTITNLTPAELVVTYMDDYDGDGTEELVTERYERIL